MKVWRSPIRAILLPSTRKSLETFTIFRSEHLKVMTIRFQLVHRALLPLMDSLEIPFAFIICSMPSNICPQSLEKISPPCARPTTLQLNFRKAYLFLIEILQKNSGLNLLFPVFLGKKSIPKKLSTRSHLFKGWPLKTLLLHGPTRF